MIERKTIPSARGENPDLPQANHSILWRRLDRPGHEAAVIFFVDNLWHLSGTAVFAHEEKPCRLDYQVLCDAEWRTHSARVTGWIAGKPVEVEISADSDRRWRLNHQECPQVAGCLDVDLNFSPATNLLPIRRLNPANGQETPVRAAWLRFPEFRLEPLEQVYRRVDERTYAYQSDGGRFGTEIEVNAFGLVTRYPGFWQMEASAGTPLRRGA